MNAVILAGHITSMNKKAYSIQFTLKTSEKGYKTARNITIPDRVDYHICYAQSQISNYIFNNFSVGDSVQIYGKIQNTIVKNEDGECVKLTFIKVLNVNLYTYEDINLRTVGKENVDIDISKINPIMSDFGI